MLVNSESPRGSSQVSTGQGCTGMKLSHQSGCPHAWVGAVDHSTTGTNAQCISKSTEIRSDADCETNPTPILPTDLEDCFHNDTDTVMGVYGSGSTHSSVSDDSTIPDVLRTGSPFKVDSRLVQEIGSHFLHDGARNITNVQFFPPSLVQSIDTCEPSEMVERTYGKNLEIWTEYCLVHELTSE